MKIAIVGAGVSGLVSAWMLHAEHEVTVFEAGAYAGGHVNTVDVEVGGERHAVDTGFIVFNERHYPEFTKILRELGVATQPTSMSFSVKCERSGLEYNGSSLNRLFAQRRNLVRPRFWRMLQDILRFGRDAPGLVADHDDTTTVAEFVLRGGYSEEFAENYLVPLGSSLWSVPARTFREFPIRFVVDFLENHDMLRVKGRPEWLVIRGGSRTYVEALTRPFADRIRLKTPIARVERWPDRVWVTPVGGEAERFDHVIFACHADQALRMLADPSDAEREILSAFPYQANRTVLHTDTSVMPERRRAWGAWNYHIAAEESDRATLTYDMNILQSLRSGHEFLVTLNDAERIEPGRVLGSFDYEHPVYTTGRAAAWARRGEMIGRNRTSYCGAYWGYGFHEDGVRSALEVAAHFGRTL